jgi:RING-box protein 1
MADVDMTDAPVAAGTAAPAKKVPTKATKAVDNGADGKKRFEVKKASGLELVPKEFATDSV